MSTAVEFADVCSPAAAESPPRSLRRADVTEDGCTQQRGAVAADDTMDPPGARCAQRRPCMGVEERKLDQDIALAAVGLKTSKTWWKNTRITPR